MRKAFIRTLIELAEKDKRIMLLTGDVGFSFLEDFRDKFPDRFVNMGVAEQNMIGVSAGLALSGKIVFVYSIVPFVTMRGFEQIRNDLCSQNLQVRLIGIGGGFTYGTLGGTHHAIEDFAIMRSLINMTVIAPGDPVETEMAIRRSIDYPGPFYLRLGKGPDPVLHSSIDFKIGKGILMEEGKDVSIFAAGSMLNTARQVTDDLKKNGLSVRLISMPTIKPLDAKLVLGSIEKTKAIFTIEEHNIIGGLSSAVSEVVAGSYKKIFFMPFALQEGRSKVSGAHDFMLEKSGLTASNITENILNSWNNIIK